MKRVLATYCWFIALASAQPAITTTYETIVTNLNAVPYTSSPTRQIGQTFHSVVAKMTAVPAHTCTSTGATGLYLTLEGSYDNLTYTPFTVLALGNVATAKGFYADGRGVYPNVRAHVYSFDTTNCLLTIYYGGAAAPAVPAILPNAQSNYQTYRIASLIGTAAFTQTISDLGVGAPSVYAVSAFNGGTSAESISFAVVTEGTACSTLSFPATNGVNIIVPPGGCSVLPMSTAAWLDNYNSAAVLCFVQSASSATHNLTVNAIYRVE